MYARPLVVPRGRNIQIPQDRLFRHTFFRNSFCLFENSNSVPRLSSLLTTHYFCILHSHINRPFKYSPWLLRFSCSECRVLAHNVYSPSAYLACPCIILTIYTAIGEALGVLGYQNAYHMTTVGPNDHHDKWVAALEAKFEGKGKEFGKEEFEELFKGYDVSIY